MVPMGKTRNGELLTTGCSGDHWFSARVGGVTGGVYGAYGAYA
jgi:hypothetical protein